MNLWCSFSIFGLQTVLALTLDSSSTPSFLRAVKRSVNQGLREQVLRVRAAMPRLFLLQMHRYVFLILILQNIVGIE